MYQPVADGEGGGWFLRSWGDAPVLSDVAMSRIGDVDMHLLRVLLHEKSTDDRECLAAYFSGVPEESFELWYGRGSFNHTEARAMALLDDCRAMNPVTMRIQGGMPPYHIEDIPPLSVSETASHWTDDELCVQVDQVLFDDCARTYRVPQYKINAAKKICSLCTVSQECLAFAREKGITSGIYGGLDPEERQTT